MILSLNQIVFSKLHFRAECCIPTLDILMNPISAIFLLLKGDFLFLTVRLEIKPRVLYMLGEWSTAELCHLPGFLKLWFLKVIRDLCLNCLFLFGIMRWPCYVVLAVLKPGAILLPLLPECWYYTHTIPCMNLFFIRSYNHTDITLLFLYFCSFITLFPFYSPPNAIFIFPLFYFNVFFQCTWLLHFHLSLFSFE